MEKQNLQLVLIVKLLVKLSSIIPQSIIINSKRAKKVFTLKGYYKKKFKFIPNGYDLSILKPYKYKKIDLKKKNKIKKIVPLIGNIARYDKKKDHLNLLKALSRVKSKNINFLCILAGTNIDKNNTILVSEIKKLKLSNNIKLLGQRNDVSKVMNTLDVFVQSSSYGEGFPNVVAESMACGTPCIVTDVGDAGFIVGKTGWIVQPNNSIKLAKAIEIAFEELGSTNWDKRRKNARLRIKKNFSISKMLLSYNKVWSK